MDTVVIVGAEFSTVTEALAVSVAPSSSVAAAVQVIVSPAETAVGDSTRVSPVEPSLQA